MSEISSNNESARSDSHHGHSHHAHSPSCGHSHAGGHSEAPGQSDVERQIRRLASSASSGKRSTTVRDTYQSNTKKGWQNSLRGASASEPRVERGGGAARPRTDRNTQAEQRQRSV